MPLEESFTEDYESVTYDYDATSNYDDLMNITSFSPCFDDDGVLLAMVYAQVAFYILVLLTGLTGNSLVITTFVLSWRTRPRSLTDSFLLHLALSDLQVLLTLPLQVAEALYEEWLFGSALCRLTRGLWSMNTYSGLLLLAWISAERFSVVVLRSKPSRRGKAAPWSCCGSVTLQAAAICVSVAVAAMALSLPDFLFSEVEQNSGMCGLNIWVTGAGQRVKMALRGSLIAGFCMPCVVMAICYTAIGCVLSRGPSGPVRGQRWRRQRTLRLMVALVLLFLVFQLPYTLVLGTKLLVEWRSCAMLMWENVTYSMTYARCCLNPVLYALVGVRFRHDVLRLLRDAGFKCFSSPLTSDPNSGSSVSPSSPFPATSTQMSSPTSPKPLLTSLPFSPPPKSQVFVFPRR